MTEMQAAMLALYKACKNQYNSKDSCRGCLLVDAESIELAGGDDYFSTCEANYPKVWDALHTWLKEEEQTMGKIELKPCPFCGGEAEIVPTGNSIVGWKKTEVRCKSCRMGRSFRWINRKFDRDFIWEKTAEQWNRRTDDERK